MADITMCECFARDGLRHDTIAVTTADKIALLNTFTEVGSNLYNTVPDLPYGETMAAGRDLNAKMRSVRKVAKTPLRYPHPRLLPRSRRTDGNADLC
jgi:hypothetical protein